ncbi:MAG: polyketide cyclase [Alphaproteobacteria bacterium]|nr:polyketide cyclase [Alphaproteobacteria bacterium]
MSGVTHNTFVIEREYPKGPKAVFAAFSDPAKKKKWYASGAGSDPVSYECDFRVGGREVMARRMKPGTPIAGAVLTWAQTFDVIVENDRIVFSQTLDRDGARISVALVTIELEASGPGCRLTLTHQAAFFEGADGPRMREAGWGVLLDGIGAALD